MTEAEAKKRWCPMGRGLVEVGDASLGVAVAAINFFHTNTTTKDTRTRCIASGCMMWRDAGKVLDLKSGGYCGLAGKP